MSVLGEGRGGLSIQLEPPTIHICHIRNHTTHHLLDCTTAHNAYSAYYVHTYIRHIHTLDVSTAFVCLCHITHRLGEQCCTAPSNPLQHCHQTALCSLPRLHQRVRGAKVDGGEPWSVWGDMGIHEWNALTKGCYVWQQQILWAGKCIIRCKWIPHIWEMWLWQLDYCVAVPTIHCPSNKIELKIDVIVIRICTTFYVGVIPINIDSFPLLVHCFQGERMLRSKAHDIILKVKICLRII